MAEIKIRLRPNGPLVIEGVGPLDAVLQIVDHQGNPFTIPANKPVIALCRCGHSSNKPFCDGAHKNCGFLAEELASPPVPPAPAA
jgi:CDGSH iron-sulfur domain-containing protein 3